MRSRAVGARRSGVPEVVLVQGMAVADYLLPGLGSFASWTRAHLVELPGFAGSGEPPYELDVTEFARCVSDWLAGHDLGTVMLAGHSSGTRGSRRTHGQNRCGGSPATCLIPEARDETSHRVGVAVERPLR